MEIRKVKLSEIIPYENNPRKNDRATDAVAESIRQCGYRQKIIVDENMVIIAGHTRLKALKKLGWKEAEVQIETDMPEETKRKYRLLDNKTNELAEWDEEKLLEELSGLDFEGFDFEFPEFNVQTGEAEEDEFDATPPEEPETKPGDIWVLGRHRLLCGDATDVNAVERLLDGKQADLYLTDPPYNVDYHGGTGMTIQNDNMEDVHFREFLGSAFNAARSVMKAGAAFYIWHADSEGYNFRGACRDAGMTVKQCLIWEKNALVLGRQDYQWRHEPCQPAGTLVWTPNGKVPIENLKDGDKVISFDPLTSVVKGYREGYEIKTASRRYDGILYGISAKGRQTWATDNHEFSIRFNPETAQTWSTYLMVNEKGWWRVGVTRTYDARGFGLKHRYDQEHAVAAWIIETFESQADAQMGEQYIACKYGIPYTHWNVQRGQSDFYNQRSEKQIEWLYDRFSKDELRNNADRLLSDYGRSIRFPLVCEEVKSSPFSRRSSTKINACNIIPDLMMIPVPKEHYEDNKTFEWEVIDTVDKKEHHNMVYSIAVSTYHHYIADGIVTHNCLYGWVDGASHAWYSDRKQTTILQFDRPTKNGDHPTMKPVKLFDYLIQNSTKGGDIVFDGFAGSGTTVVACEQDGRTACVMELDPRYCDVIKNRWEKLTGQKAVLLDE